MHAQMVRGSNRKMPVVSPWGIHLYILNETSYFSYSWADQAGCVTKLKIEFIALSVSDEGLA